VRNAVTRLSLDQFGHHNVNVSQWRHCWLTRYNSFLCQETS